MERDSDWMDQKELRRQKRLKKKTAHSRLWFASAMGPVMSKYGINYIKLFDSLDPDSTYRIVQEILRQYRFDTNKISAQLIVAAIKSDYNAIKITDRDHELFKREQAKEKANMLTQRYFWNYMEG